MIFTSHVFVYVFLPLVLGLSAVLPRGAKNGFLAVASYVFYGWWNPWFVLLMLASTVIDWLCGRVVADPEATDRRRRAAVAVSVTSNLSLLGFFKYWMFFAGNVNALLGSGVLPVWTIVLPVGISFYTFQSMSYTIDLYRGQAQRARSFVDFAAYVALFPQLVAGPIVRYRDLADELVTRSVGLERFARGLSIFVLGFGKKVLLANNLAPIADAAFAADAPPSHVAWIGIVAYAFQIYFDFSGYSDMAIGLGHLFGFTFPENFRSPYRAASITEFWKRWHISLSTWLRDYLYIPLGGNRRGRGRTYFNLGVTMLLGGLWHGAQWQFVVWGALHGGMLAAERALGLGVVDRRRGKRFVRIGTTFVLVLVTWVFFRAATLEDALRFLGAMAGAIPATEASTLVSAVVLSRASLVVLAVAAALVFVGRRTEEWVGGRGLHRDWRTAWLVPVLLFLSLAEMSVQGFNPFLYFQF